MCVPFDLKNLTVTGVPAPVLNNVQTNNETGSMSYALSNEGTIIYAPDTGSDNDIRSVLNVDLSGRETEFFDLKKRFEYARYSPDGKHVGFVIKDENDANIWIYNIAEETINQLTFYKGDAIPLFAWSPDSKTLAYSTAAEDSTNSIYVKRIDGTGVAHKIYTSTSVEYFGIRDWSQDGDKVAFNQQSANGWDIFIYSFQDSSAKPFLATPVLEVEPNFSPNGKWLTYISEESGKWEIYVRPYPESTGGVWKVSNGIGWKPVWSPDGEKIFYRSGNALYSVSVKATDTFSKGNPEKIFEGNYFLGLPRRFDIHPDGDRFIMIQPQQDSQQNQNIFVIQNFGEELKRLVPVGRE